jgi:Ribbon-helix-helix domain
MKSGIVKRSVNIIGRKTSVSLEDGFWNALKQIAYPNDHTPRPCFEDRQRARGQRFIVGNSRIRS